MGVKKYKCITQQNHHLLFTGPSGNNYQSICGLSFEVSNELDQQHFSNSKRFEEVGLIASTVEKIKGKPMGRDDGASFEKLLKSIKVLKKPSVKILIDQFQDLQTLTDHVRHGGELPQELSPAEMVAVKEALGHNVE